MNLKSRILVIGLAIIGRCVIFLSFSQTPQTRESQSVAYGRYGLTLPYGLTSRDTMQFEYGLFWGQRRQVQA